MTKPGYQDPFHTVNRDRPQAASGQIGSEASMLAHLACAPRFVDDRRRVVAMPPALRDDVPLTPKMGSPYEPFPPYSPYPQRFEKPNKPRERKPNPQPKRELTLIEQAALTIRARSEINRATRPKHREPVVAVDPLTKKAQTVAKRVTS